MIADEFFINDSGMLERKPPYGDHVTFFEGDKKIGCFAFDTGISEKDIWECFESNLYQRKPETRFERVPWTGNEC